MKTISSLEEARKLKPGEPARLKPGALKLAPRPIEEETYRCPACGLSFPGVSTDPQVLPGVRDTMERKDPRQGPGGIRGMKTISSMEEARRLKPGEPARWKKGRQKRPPTARQAWAIRSALRLGFYDIPRRAILSDLSEELGLSRAGLSELLRRGEQRLIVNYCESPGPEEDKRTSRRRAPPRRPTA